MPREGVMVHLIKSKRLYHEKTHNSNSKNLKFKCK